MGGPLSSKSEDSSHLPGPEVWPQKRQGRKTGPEGFRFRIRIRTPHPSGSASFAFLRPTSCLFSDESIATKWRGLGRGGALLEISLEDLDPQRHREDRRAGDEKRSRDHGGLSGRPRSTAHSPHRAPPSPRSGEGRGEDSFRAGRACNRCPRDRLARRDRVAGAGSLRP